MQETIQKGVKYPREEEQQINLINALLKNQENKTETYPEYNIFIEPSYADYKDLSLSSPYRLYSPELRLDEDFQIKVKTRKNYYFLDHKKELVCLVCKKQLLGFLCNCPSFVL